MYYQPLFNNYVQQLEHDYVQKPVNLLEIFFQHQTSSCTFSVCLYLTYVQRIEKIQIKTVKEVDFMKYAQSTIIYYVQWLGTEKQNSVNFL